MNIQKSLSKTLSLSLFLATVASPGFASEAPQQSPYENSASLSSPKTTSELQPKTIKPWIKSNRYKRTTIRKGRTVTVEYPKFVGEPKESIANLNKLMKRFVNGHMPALEINTDPNLSDFEFDCNYQVMSLSTDLISVDMNFYSFTGGAHGNTFTVPFNYRFTDNGPKEITLENIFGKKPDLKTLQRLVRPRLVEELYPDDDGADREWIDSGTQDLSCFKYISVDEDGLTFNFQQYQVACYAAGMPSITVSYNDLKDLFTPASPIYSIVKAAVHDNAETTKTAMK